MDEAVNRYHSLLAVGYRVYGKSRPVEYIAADEDIGLGGLQRDLVGDGGAVRSQLDLRSLKKVAPLGALPYRH